MVRAFHEMRTLIICTAAVIWVCKPWKHRILCSFSSLPSPSLRDHMLRVLPWLPVMGCCQGPPSSGMPSGSPGWPWQTGWGPLGLGGLPGCLDQRCQPGTQPRKGRAKKKNHISGCSVSHGRQWSAVYWQTIGKLRCSLGPATQS